MQLKSFSAISMIALVAIMLITSVNAGSAYFNQISEATKALTFTLSFPSDKLFPSSHSYLDNIFNLNINLLGVETQVVPELWVYGVSQWGFESFRGAQYVVKGQVNQSGEISFSLSNLQFSSQWSLDDLSNLKIIGEFKGTAGNPRDLKLWGSIQNTKYDDYQDNWSFSSRYFLNAMPLASSFDVSYTPKIDQFGRNYNSFKLTIQGFNEELLKDNIAVFRLIDLSPSQSGQVVQPSRLATINPSMKEGCYLEEDGLELPSSVSPYEDSFNVLEFDPSSFKRFRNLHRVTISCPNVGIYQSNSFSTSTPSSSVQSKQFQLIQKQIGLDKDDNNATPSVMRLLMVGQKNFDYTIDNWIN